MFRGQLSPLEYSRVSISFQDYRHLAKYFAMKLGLVAAMMRALTTKRLHRQAQSTRNLGTEPSRPASGPVGTGVHLRKRSTLI